MQEARNIKLGDLDVETGYLYCGGEKEYLEVLRVLFYGAVEVRKQVQEAYQTQNWKQYIISVHGIKSSMLGVGAMTLSEMAKHLETAGKNEDYQYIEAHHEAMLKEYDRIYVILSENEQINPLQEEPADICQDMPFLEEKAMEQYCICFEEAVYEFDEDRMLGIIRELQKYQWNGKCRTEELSAVKRKIEKMDYMSALDLLHQIVNC